MAPVAPVTPAILTAPPPQNCAIAKKFLQSPKSSLSVLGIFAGTRTSKPCVRHGHGKLGKISSFLSRKKEITFLM